MKDLITIGLLSKGRLKDKSISFLIAAVLKFYKVVRNEIILLILKIENIKVIFHTQKKLYKELLTAQLILVYLVLIY